MVPSSLPGGSDEYRYQTAVLGGGQRMPECVRGAAAPAHCLQPHRTAWAVGWLASCRRQANRTESRMDRAALAGPVAAAPRANVRTLVRLGHVSVLSPLMDDPALPHADRRPNENAAIRMRKLLRRRAVKKLFMAVQVGSVPMLGLLHCQSSLGASHGLNWGARSKSQERQQHQVRRIDLWALAAVPLIGAIVATAPYVPRLRWAFYASIWPWRSRQVCYLEKLSM